MAEKRIRAPVVSNDDNGLARAFLWILLGLGATGLVLTVFRSTPAMGLLLALHLGVVFAFFVTLPYGKFIHGLYRFAALMRHAHEQFAEHGEDVMPPKQPLPRQAAE
jgi:citrate/tricarballylate utilization protein